MGHAAAPVTMRTLADRLGVSVTTVSNAYSKPDRLSDDLRDQILATAKELGYCGPSAAGRALRSGKTDVCGFLFGGELADAFADPYTIAFLAGLSETAEKFGSSILLLRSPGEGDDAESQLLQRAPIDAIVTCSATSEHPATELLLQRGVRVVGAGISEDGDWVAVNDVKAGRLIGKHLAKLGHRRIVVVVPGETPDDEAFEVTPEELLLRRRTLRCRTFPGTRREAPRREDQDRLRRLQAEAGRSPRSRAGTRRPGPPDRDRRHERCPRARCLGRGARSRPQARQGHLDRGLRRHPDAAFVGLTTVRQPITDKGRFAGRLAMDPDYPQRQITLPVELVVRSSAGPAPRS